MEKKTATAATNIEQIIEVAPHKTAAVRPLTTYHENYQSQTTRHAGHCWSRSELISGVLLWTPSHGRTKSGQPARTYIQHLCTDTGCNPEDLPEAMDDRKGWREVMMMMISVCVWRVPYVANKKRFLTSLKDFRFSFG